jgi:uncharacterized membrane protein
MKQATVHQEATVPKIFHRTHDPIWHLQLGVLLIIILQFITAPALLPYNKYLMIGLELWLMGALAIVTPDGYHRVSRSRRTFALTLIGVVAIGNIFSLALLLQALLSTTHAVSGVQLLLNAITIYASNIILFALFYWEMDGGGPDKRAGGRAIEDFLFTQQAHPRFAGKGWLPGFTDYLYLSATTVTNFAAADTVPLTHRAKAVMMVQELVSVILVVLVAAHAVSILQ